MAVPRPSADQDRLGLQDRIAEQLQTRLTQSGAGLDHVGDHIGDAEPDGGLDRAVQGDQPGDDAVIFR